MVQLEPVLVASVLAVAGKVIVLLLTVTVPVLNTGAELKVCTPVKVLAASILARVAEVVGKV